MPPKTQGLIAAPFTPLDAQGCIRPDAVPAYAEFLRRNGVSGVFVNGTTGEGLSLTLEERKALASAWVSAASGLKIVIHVGATCVDDAQLMARHAQEIGADAVAALPPFFFKPATPRELASALRPIAAAAPALPFYYYHIPSMTGVSIAVHEFLEAAADIPNLAGAKFTYENLMDFQLCLAAQGGRFDILFGRDEILLAGLALGACGAVGSTYNFAAPLYISLLAAFERGDLAEARKRQLQAAEMIRFVVASGIHPIAAFKAGMKFLGIDCGPLRPPLPTATPEQETMLRTGLERIGFFGYACR